MSRASVDLVAEFCVDGCVGEDAYVRKKERTLRKKKATRGE
jgi:hypothetical protein